MDTVNTLKNKNVIKLRSKKLRSKKLRIQKTKKFATLCIILLSLLIIGTSIKNMYVYFRCSDFIYSLDYYFTHWKDKDLRLIEVDSFSVLSKTNNTVEIEAYGFAYKLVELLGGDDLAVKKRMVYFNAFDVKEDE